MRHKRKEFGSQNLGDWALRISPEEQKQLYYRGGEDSREKLIRSVVAWALTLAQDFSASKSSMSLDDATSLAMLGVVKAVDSWDPKKGRLVTHTGYHVRGELLDNRHKLLTVVSVPIEPPQNPKYLPYFEKARKVVRSVGETLEIPRERGDLEKQEEKRQEKKDIVNRAAVILNARERRILQLVSQGVSSRVIAEMLQKEQLFGIRGNYKHEGRVGSTRVLQIKDRAIEKLRQKLGIQKPT